MIYPLWTRLLAQGMVESTQFKKTFVKLDHCPNLQGKNETDWKSSPNILQFKTMVPQLQLRLIKINKLQVEKQHWHPQENYWKRIRSVQNQKPCVALILFLQIDIPLQITHASMAFHQGELKIINNTIIIHVIVYTYIYIQWIKLIHRHPLWVKCQNKSMTG